MKLSTALKISGICLFALGAEALLSYLVFSNHANRLAETGQYSIAEAYASGPMGEIAKGFYVVFGITIFIGLAAPIVSLLTMGYKKLFR